MNKKAVIFDMDGTLADTFTLVLGLAREMQVLHESITAEDIERMRNLPATVIFKELKIPLHRVPGLLVKGRVEFAKRITEVLLIKDIEVVLKALHGQSTAMYVISSNGLENIQKFLANNKIEHYFSDIQGGVGVFGKTKSLRRLLKKHDIAKDNAIYVGDEVRDIEAAKKTGVDSAAVTWGYNGGIILKQTGPTIIAHSPKELKNLLTEWAEK